VNKLQNDPQEQNILAEDTPVTMPELPLSLTITTIEQFKAIGDRTRTRILGIIQYQPATAKQIADKLKMSPGTINHHLQVLEAAGLAQVVARRLVRGIVAKYYTRTARIFRYAFPSEVAGPSSGGMDIMNAAMAEYTESLATQDQDTDDEFCSTSFPRASLSQERVRYYHERVTELVNEFLNEPADADGEIYSLLTAMFKAPAYLQTAHTSVTPDDSVSDKDR
jgi:DNA-binding transcriptional ArsR family regulator